MNDELEGSSHGLIYISIQTTAWTDFSKPQTPLVFGLRFYLGPPKHEAGVQCSVTTHVLTLY
jgi:hypothetical protein